MDERVPGSVRPIVTRYLQRIEERLPGLVEGVYLHGSIALDAFNPRLSDVDLVTVVRHRLAEPEVEQLRWVRRAVRQEYPQPKLDGVDVPWEDLARAFERDPVTWWVVKKRGIALFGPPAETLPVPVDLDLLLRWMRGNLNSFWVSYTRRPKRVAALLTDWGAEWTVLGVLRQFYTFREHEITSKRGAGHYALSCLPARWHRLIREAIRIREGGHCSLYRSRLGRAGENLRFLRYIIAVCNRAGDDVVLARTRRSLSKEET